MGAGRALVVFVVYLVTQIVVAIVILVAYGMFVGDAVAAFEDFDSGLLLVAGAVGIMIGGVAVLGMTQVFVPAPTLRATLAQVGFVKVKPGAIGGAVLLGAGIVVLALFGVQAMVPPTDGAEGPLVQAASAPGWPRFVFILLAVLLAPLVEELLFRGVMYTGFLRSMSPGMAGFLVTTLFALMHITEVAGYWPSLFVIFLAGAAMLVVRVRTGSVWPAVALHVTYNLLQVGLLYLVPGV